MDFTLFMYILEVTTLITVAMTLNGFLALKSKEKEVIEHLQPSSVPHLKKLKWYYVLCRLAVLVVTLVTGAGLYALSPLSSPSLYGVDQVAPSGVYSASGLVILSSALTAFILLTGERLTSVLGPIFTKSIEKGLQFKEVK